MPISCLAETPLQPLFRHTSFRLDSLRSQSSHHHICAQGLGAQKCDCLSSCRAFWPTCACLGLFVLADDLSKKLNRCFLGPTAEVLVFLKTQSLGNIAGCFFQIAQFHFRFRILHQIHEQRTWIEYSWRFDDSKGVDAYRPLLPWHPLLIQAPMRCSVRQYCVLTHS